MAVISVRHFFIFAMIFIAAVNCLMLLFSKQRTFYFIRMENAPYVRVLPRKWNFMSCYLEVSSLILTLVSVLTFHVGIISILGIVTSIFWLARWERSGEHIEYGGVYFTYITRHSRLTLSRPDVASAHMVPADPWDLYVIEILLRNGVCYRFRYSDYMGLFAFYAWLTENA